MKFQGYVIIQQPRAMVVEYFEDPNYLKEYQDGFLRKIQLNGEAGADGAVSNLYYQYRKSEMELTGTITPNLLPDSFEASYHRVHVDNTMKCTFI